MCGVIVSIIKPMSVVDVGCGTGDLIGFMNKTLGIKQVSGIELDRRVLGHILCRERDITFMDLRIPQGEIGRRDLALCFSVAEHIDPESSDIFIYNVSQCGGEGSFRGG